MSNEESRSRSAFSWESTTVGSLGGPLLVCAADAFAAWGGAVHDADYELDPACDYARAWSAVHPDDDDREAAFVRFGDRDEHAGLVWEMDGEGSAAVAYGRSGDGSGSDADGLLLMRTWVPRGRADAPRRRAAGASVAGEEQVGALELRTGRVVVAWAAVAASEAGPFATPQDVDHFAGLHAVLRVRPGTYRVTCGWHEGPGDGTCPGRRSTDRPGPPRTTTGAVAGSASPWRATPPPRGELTHQRCAIGWPPVARRVRMPAARPAEEEVPAGERPGAAAGGEPDPGIFPAIPGRMGNFPVIPSEYPNDRPDDVQATVIGIRTIPGW
ncbi:hypothetical protein [Kitasatospora sp. NPDC088346]|uniref:hypothetical protein n=1 Tax=Kitasatospora sp. NPDC088346 TaxID=3364073 RepID=UPI003822E256